MSQEPASTTASARTLCVVIHDVAPPTWPGCRRVLAAIEEIAAVPVTLLAVPRWHGAARDAGFEKWLVERAGQVDEVALHGFWHLDDGQPRSLVDRWVRHVYTRGEGEFVDLSFQEAIRRLDSGLAWLHALGIAPQGFVAPAWLMSEGTWRAVRYRGFDYTCTLRHIHQFRPKGRDIVCQSQVYSSSSAWRRAASIAWNAALARHQTNDPIARLELHPFDADHGPLRRSWQRLLREQLRTRAPSTLASLRTDPALMPT